MKEGALQIAVIGGGVAGVTTSYLLQRKHRITLFEKNNYVGGHTNTIAIDKGPDAGIAVDTGFIVLNDKNYPLLHKLLKKWDCPVRWSDMSFGFYSKETGIQFAGSSLNGLFAQRANLFRPSYIRMLREIVRFCRTARRDLQAGGLEGKTMGDYLAEGRYSQDAVRNYIIPMGAAIWSAPHSGMFEFPALAMLRFWENHGLLSLEDRPRWQTVVGGSNAYIKSFLRDFSGRVVTSATIAHVRRDHAGAVIRMSDGTEERFDRVVVATHADEALKLLADPSPEESRLLGAWRYTRNFTVLHTDASFLPPNRRAWASWNYVEENDHGRDGPVTVTYHMNRLQGLKSNYEYCVSLNPARAVEPACVIREIEYMHPLYTFDSLRTQGQLRELNGKQNTFFCGSYFGYGFHEDAVRSAVSVANTFGIEI